jgi:hypothetical protein
MTTQRDDRRRPPAFQCYASDTLADRRFLLMSAGERGLLLTMRMACWVGDEVPADPVKLARVVGLPVDEVTLALTPAVIGNFRPVVGDADSLHDPELDAQMQRMLERRRINAESGSKGGKAAHGSGSSNRSSERSSNRSSALSRAEQSRAEPKRTEPRFSKKAHVADDDDAPPWIDDPPY